jgi:hypothetical protein
VLWRSDLALLRVDDPLFWAQVEPMQFTDTPQLQDKIIVAGSVALLGSRSTKEKKRKEREKERKKIDNWQRGVLEGKVRATSSACITPLHKSFSSSSLSLFSSLFGHLHAFVTCFFPLSFRSFISFRLCLDLSDRYPTGGDNLSITSGVVSRVDLQRYAHGGLHQVAPPPLRMYFMHGWLVSTLRMPIPGFSFFSNLLPIPLCTFVFLHVSLPCKSMPPSTRATAGALPSWQMVRGGWLALPFRFPVFPPPLLFFFWGNPQIYPSK